jgi:hypothetical protein
MKDFSTSLLREKFVIYDPQKGMADKKSTVIALSNRMVAELRNDKGELIETYAVRAQNMHSCVRMVARIIQTFQQNGPIATRAEAFKWDAAWDQIVNDYEYAYNIARWVAIYHNGKCVYTKGDHHVLLDMIEKCDHENEKDYDYAVPLAEKLFTAAGKNLRIEHDSNVALSVHFENDQARLGIIQRGSNRTTTFTFTATPKKVGQAINIPQCLGAAAAFLEGVQLSFLVGMNTEKIRIGIIERFSKEEKQTREGRQRLSRLSSEISNLESAFEIRYRPERPEFHHLMMDAEKLGQKILLPPEKPKEG